MPYRTPLEYPIDYIMEYSVHMIPPGDLMYIYVNFRVLAKSIQKGTS